MTRLMPDPTQRKPCDKCQHFGRWLPIEVAGVVRLDVHCWCAEPGAQRVIAGPQYGCAFWVAAISATPAPAAHACPGSPGNP